MSADVATIHVVDDDASVRTAVGRVLRASGYQISLYESADQLLQNLPPPERGCILLDQRMPGLTGTQLQERLTESGCSLPIIFLSGHGDIPTSVRAIKSGAEDFLSKPVRQNVLLDAVQRALKRYDDEQQRNGQLRRLHEHFSLLTPREREVFRLVVRGKLNKQIAHDLGTSERTIKAHRHKIMEKFKVRSVAELVSIAEKLDVLPP